MDCANAAGAINAPEIFKNFNIELTELYCEPERRECAYVPNKEFRGDVA